MTAALKQGALNIELSPAALTKEYINSHKQQYSDMISAIVIGLIAKIYQTNEEGAPQLTDREASLICARFKAEMDELKPYFEIARAMLQDEMKPYANLALQINKNIRDKYPALDNVIKNPKLANANANRFILGNLLMFSKSK